MSTEKIYELNQVKIATRDEPKIKQKRPVEVVVLPRLDITEVRGEE